MWRTVVAQREKDRLVAEEKVKKLKMKREKVEVMIILIAAGKTEWRILNCQNLQEQCRKRSLVVGNKATTMIERIKKCDGKGKTSPA